MKLSSLQLEAFFAVSRTLNFSRAAAEVHITQPALSQRILNLEDELETTLFIRDTSGLRLTETGETLLRYCQTHAALEEEVVSKLVNREKDILSGTIRIAGFSSVMRSIVMPRLDALVQKNPKIQVEIFVREFSELPKLLRQGQADFIVTDHILNAADLEFVKIGEEINVLATSTRAEKRTNTYLDHDSEDQTTIQFFKNQNKPLPAQFQRLYLDDIYGILDGVIAGWGRAVVPEHLIYSRKGIRVVPGFKPLRVPIVLHYYRQPYYSRLFASVLKALSKERRSTRS